MLCARNFWNCSIAYRDMLSAENRLLLLADRIEGLISQEHAKWVSTQEQPRGIEPVEPWRQQEEFNNTWRGKLRCSMPVLAAIGSDADTEYDCSTGGVVAFITDHSVLRGRLREW
jgi:hypothetical protein